MSTNSNEASSSSSTLHLHASPDVPDEKPSRVPASDNPEEGTHAGQLELGKPLSGAAGGAGGAGVLEMEMMLRTRTRVDGIERHRSRRGGDVEAKGVVVEGQGSGVCDGNDDRAEDGEGVVERTAMVDLGKGPEEVIVVDWVEDDPENPFNWAPSKKLLNLAATIYLTAITALSLTSVGITAVWGAPRFGVSQEDWLWTLTVSICAVAVTPLGLAPLSEVFGRVLIYQVTTLIFLVLFIPQALCTNFSVLLAVRWLQGMSGSVGNSMVGGTIADMYRPAARGHAMNAFTYLIFAGQAVGGLLGWVGMYLGISWCYWIQAIVTGSSLVINVLCLSETRSDVLLSRRAKRLTKQTGRKHLCAADLEKQSFATLMKVSIVRPLQYLLTEPIVSALSLWIGFAFGCLFMLTASILIVFRQYGFNEGQLGTVLMTYLIGATLGTASSYHQQHLYLVASRRSAPDRPAPEIRLYWAAWGGLLFPLSMFGFAWTGRPGIPWEVPAMFLCTAMWGVFVIYSGVFTYIADAYETFSSSGQAAHSFVRGIAAGFFPLAAHKMYSSLGYPQASTLIASIATVLGVAPFLLIKYGPALRARSKVATALAAGKA